MKQIIALCMVALILSCGSNERTGNTADRKTASGKEAISFQGEFSDEFQQIMFTCDRVGIKSKIAANYFNQLAKEKDLNYRAIAKSINMTANSNKLLSNKIVSAYRKKGLKIKNPAIVGFRTKDIETVESVYMLDNFNRYDANDKFIDWTDVEGGPSVEDFGLENIKAKVDALIANY